jgi:hypothetical protein
VGQEWDEVFAENSAAKNVCFSPPNPAIGFANLRAMRTPSPPQGGSLQLRRRPGAPAPARRIYCSANFGVDRNGSEGQEANVGVKFVSAGVR